jgi:hypothetical protein
LQAGGHRFDSDILHKPHTEGVWDEKLKSIVIGVKEVEEDVSSVARASRLKSGRSSGATPIFSTKLKAES